jgi:hypothetical protein
MATFLQKHWETFINRRNLFIQWGTLYNFNQQSRQRQKRSYSSNGSGTKAETVIAVIKKIPLKQET